MGSILTLPVSARRRTALGFAIVLVCLVAFAGNVQAQDAPTRTFGSEAGLILNPIKPEATADFEMVMGRLKDALAKSEDPRRQEQAAGWKVFKSQEPGPGGSVLYVMVMDPAVPGGEYAVSKILSEAYPTEVQELYQKFSDAYAGGQSLLNLDMVSAFGAP